MGLTLAGYTLGTACPLRTRVQVAADAGFTGIGLRVEDHRHAGAEGLDDAALAELLAEHRLRLTEVELVSGWGTAADRDDEQRRREHDVFALARRFGVRHVNTALFEKLPEARIAVALRELCERAEDLVVALEFMPYGGVPDLRTAHRLLEACGAPNIALVVDTWQWVRAGCTAADLVGIPAEHIIGVQLADAGPVPGDPLRQESLHRRLLPGQGHGDVAGTVSTLVAAGVRPHVVSVEVMSDVLVAIGYQRAARAAHDAAAAVLASTPLPMLDPSPIP